MGVSIEVEDTYLISGQVGTPAFMSPEVLDHEAKKYNGVYTDLWALGVTLYSFLFGFVPWTDITPVGINNKIRTQPLKFDGYVYLIFFKRAEEHFSRFFPFLKF